MLRRYKIANVVFDADFIYAYCAHICKDYLYKGDESACFLIKTTQEDIDKEKALTPEFEQPYLESLAFYRKLLKNLIDYDAFIFHCSAIEVDGKAYLFTAPSGTGKSTHARLWRELLKDRARMINDDKPIIRKIDGEFFVFGTPFNGKHELGENICAKISAVCEINRAKENAIKKVKESEMLPTLLGQTLRYDTAKDFDSILTLLDQMCKKVDLYKLYCNMNVSAAELSYKVMSGGSDNEN